MNDDAVRRVEALVAGARRIADPTSELGRRARGELAASTGLSVAGVELALTECLETTPSAAEITVLVASVRPARRVHVVLPANVFIAAHRAIALALASSADVRVRPSRREPRFAALLAEAAPGLFTLTHAVTPEPGDELWAYGGDDALAALRAHAPLGVSFHAQGPGFGVALVAATHVTPETARALAADVVPFEQRGCLSPRAALVLGSTADAERFARLVAAALADAAARVPPGRLEDAERADARAFRDAHAYAGTVISAGPGAVAVLDAERLVLAPPGRNLVVTATHAAFAVLAAREAELTALGVAAPDALADEIARRFSNARCSLLGRMQRPAFDGPVDRRGGGPSTT
jgi:hypothetical protein